jgi:hypothetical protein
MAWRCPSGAPISAPSGPLDLEVVETSIAAALTQRAAMLENVARAREWEREVMPPAVGGEDPVNRLTARPMSAMPPNGRLRAAVVCDRPLTAATPRLQHRSGSAQPPADEGAFWPAKASSYHLRSHATVPPSVLTPSTEVTAGRALSDPVNPTYISPANMIVVVSREHSGNCQ